MKAFSEENVPDAALDSFKSSEERNIKSMADKTKQRAEKLETTEDYPFKPPPPMVAFDEALKALLENQPKQFKDRTNSTEGSHRKYSSPIGKVGAFTIYNSRNHDFALLKSVPMQGSPFQLPKQDFGISAFYDVKQMAPVIPLHCGHGCCNSSFSHPCFHNSLLGPEFVEYEDDPSFSSLELNSLAKDLKNVAWIRRVLENAGCAS